MNSERIEQKFGSYGLEILASDSRQRLSSLYSLSGGDPVCRTYARVRFMEPLDPSIAAEHARVVAGESIGSVFRSAGWTIAKRNSWIGETTLTENDADILQLMQIELPQTLATHRYAFHIEKSGRSFDYAVITEMHHPAYLTSSELKSIFNNGNEDWRIVNAE